MKRKILLCLLAASIVGMSFLKIDANELDPLVEETETHQIAVTESSFTLEKGQSQNITFTVLNNTISPSSIEFVSLDSSVASVNSSGQVRAVNPGKTQINLRIIGNTEVLASVDVTVNQIEGSIQFDDSEFFLIRGLTYRAPITVSDSLSDKTIVWSSLDPNIASVVNGVITGNKLGSTTIVAQIGDFRTELPLHVTAPLSKIAFNKDALNLISGERKEIPDLVYVPYDTTSSKTASYRSSDETIMRVSEDGFVEAVGVGQAKLIATVGRLETFILVHVAPEKTATGADILMLSVESETENRLVMRVEDMNLYRSRKFSLRFDEALVLDFVENSDAPELFVVLEDAILMNSMRNLENFIIPVEIMEALKDKTFSVHILDSQGRPQIIYHFEGDYDAAFNLNYSLTEIDSRHRLYKQTQGKAFNILFKNDRPLKSPVNIELSAQKIGSSVSQMHFIYRVEQNNLIDTEQVVTVSSQDRIKFTIDKSDYVITFNKLSIANDNVIIYLLLFTISLFFTYGVYKYVKVVKKKH